MNKPESNYLKMESKDQSFNLLGIAKRAGKIISGENLLLNAIRNHKVKFLFIANDSGNASSKKFTDKADSYQVPVCYLLSKEDISHAIGMNRTMIGITDSGFAKRFVELTPNLKKG